ncbi:Hypothetical protein CINCED_3A018045 [Cinara cedri]|uniref:Uncharacterized protein n=1 Tax=Cinara cedri TaxID=506608 RepID=A0A5E4M0N9_9HEMI|nr:Hypothetical protein CINCED_3A018045 [Cinara cedri]
MANLSASKANFSCSDTTKDLFKIFNNSIDQSVIEMVIEYRDNDMLLAYKDLTEMANTKDAEQNQNCLSNEEEKKFAAATTDLKKFNFINWHRLAKCVPPINKILYLVSKGYKVMVIMRGLPGCGKSFQAKDILNQCYTNPNSDEFIFSADKFFINKHTGRYHYNKSKINDAHLWSQQKVKHAVEHGVTPVIVDNTHTQAWEMEIYFKLSVNNGYWIEIIEPTSEWAWESKELFKKNVHNVPYDAIEPMIHRYEHNINVEKLLDRFKLKYTKKNEPPQLSKCFEKDQLSEKLTRQGVNKSSFEINEQFKDLCVSPKLNNCVEKNDQCISFKYKFEDGDNCVTQQNEMSGFEELEHFADDNQSISSTDEASNYVNKSINTCENEFKFLEFLNNPEEELYCSNYIKCIIGKPRDINKGNNYILNTYIGKLDKSTATDDLVGIVRKPTLNKLRKEFPENICQLINELFDKCNGNINWISDMLQEAGHDYISKQRLYSLIQFKENDFTKSIDVGDNIEKSKQNNVKIEQDLHRTSLDLQSNTVTFTENTSIQEGENKKKRKKRKKKIDLKENELQTTNPNYISDLRKNIENKFTFDDSLYPEHILKIKQSKENHNMLDKNDVIPPISETVDVDIIPEHNNKEKLVELAIDTSVLTQLCDYFGDVSSDLNKSKLPMSVKIPEKLAEELYCCLIANVPTRIYDQDKLLIGK